MDKQQFTADMFYFANKQQQLYFFEKLEGMINSGQTLKF
jgi:hypothetical protein